MKIKKIEYVFSPENDTDIPDGQLITILMTRKEFLKKYPDKEKQLKEMIDEINSMHNSI